MIICVDPGLSGAIVILNQTAEHILQHRPMPTKAYKSTRRVDGCLLALWLKDALKWETSAPYGIDVAVVEEVGAMPGQGVTSMFSFGHATGSVMGVLGALGIKTVLIRPQEWKRAHGLIGQPKDASRTLASSLWPDPMFSTKAKGQAYADAALMGRYYAGKTND